MYVVKKKFFSDRLIGLTLQLPGKRNVLIIGGYVPPVSSSNRSVIADCYSTLISWIHSARSLDHSVLLGGDLNADLETFLKQLTAAHPGSSPLNPLFKFLHEQRFDDLCEIDSLSLLPSPTFRSSSSGSLSRLDYIWISLFFPIPHLWSSVLDLTDVISTDHFLIVAHFDFLELKDHHAPSYIKQRQRCRTSYDFHSTSPVQKESFASAISAMLPDASSLSRAIPLNQLWHQFKSSLLLASRSHFPRVNISLTRPKDIPHELQPYTRINNSLTHFMISLRKKATISQLQLAWSRITLEFEKFKTISMKSAIAERNENFYENKGKFISSSLNRERRCIVLDRVLVVDIPDGPKLLVAPEEIKAAAITHFQNVVGPSVSPFDSLSTLPPRWKKRYAPLEQFQESLYDPVMADISVSELREVISLSPTHKAPGPSSIPYECGLNVKLPVGLCLDLMPRQSVPLVTLSSELANSEKATWLFSPLWCLSQLIDPFRQFLLTWTDLKRLNLVPKTSKTPSWFTRLTNIPDLISYLPVFSGVVAYPPYLLTLQGSALDVIDEQSRIKARNRYYWIAGLDSSDSMIFGRVFYTVDVHGTRIVYFSHWINSSSNRFVLSPCQGCSLHDASIVDGPLQVRSVGSKLSHRSCLTFLPSYRCLQLFHMPTRIDSTCNNINLFLSPFLLCSFFKILLGYSCVRVPELFLVNPGIPSNVPTTVDVSPPLPTAPPTLIPAIHLCSHLHIYLYAKKHNTVASSPASIGCGWIQRDDDSFILESGSFLWTNGPISPQASELGFILLVLCLLPSNCSINFYSVHSYALLYEQFSGSSPERRVRFPCYLLWMAIHEQIVTLCLDCSFHTITKASADPYLSRCIVLVDSLSSNDHSFSFNSLMESPPFRRLLVVSLCNGVPLVTDPVGYWRNFTDMRDFFDIMNLSRFTPLRSSYSSIDWNLTFNLFKETLYQRLDVASISSSQRFRLQLWFLLGLSEIYIPEPFLVSDISSLPQSDNSPAHIPLDPTHRLVPAFALSSGTHFHIVGTVHEEDLSTSQLVCAWVQTLDDYILESGVFSCPVVSPYKDVAELTFIIYVLNSLPPDSAVEFSSLLQLHLSYHNWMNASSIKRVRLKNNFLWSCVFELIRSKHISCGFNGLIRNAPISSYLARAQQLIKESSQFKPSRLVSLMDEIFPSSLKTMGLFTGFDELVTQDPVTYWRTVTDIKNFFSLLGLSRFERLQTSFHAVDWALSFDTF
ncbi:hypothetical protein RhiirA4_430771 [Rhizophagus irregularis]|uniref:Endonuclease/exonuclease/phosphatase domain-containing protein n=1 Tax=Rhizophagus irregularis TaxID=588596 RepID=A0A2I1HM61_9GLOM|nr:hypothetical protein RhiirA4_430771 [Rhizophagus irregularis]